MQEKKFRFMYKIILLSKYMIEYEFEKNKFSKNENRTAI